MDLIHPGTQRGARADAVSPESPPLVVPLAGLTHRSLALAGGKAANLGRLIHAGFAVPDGFCVTTAAYDLIHEVAALDSLLDRLAAHPVDDEAGLAVLAEAVRAAVLRAAVPPDVVRAITMAYHALDGSDAVPVAVRSSATAEDLPDASFAGQQDTFLNVVGPGALLDAVQRCWASLWSDRAVSYRVRRGIDPRTVSLAVVVQRMVAARCAGVLFTANPVSGKRHEAVIEASAGLGDALVAGATTPDHVAVTSTGQIVERHWSDQPDVGPAGHPSAACLSDAHARTLAALGRRIEAHVGAPQDIEWAIDAADQVWVLQARPITTLFPVPPDAPTTDNELRVYLCFNVQQGTTRPFTPLGISGLRRLASTIITVIGVPPSDVAQGPRFVTEAAGRLFLDVTGALRTALGRTVLTRVLADAEVQAALIFDHLVADPRLSLRPVSMGAVAWTLTRLLVQTRAAWYVLQALLAPAVARARVARLERALRRPAAVPPRAGALEHLAAAEHLLDATPRLLFDASPVMLAGMLSLTLAHRLLGDLASDSDLQRTLGGASGNVTTEMTLALWALAEQVGADAATRQEVVATPPAELAVAYRAERLPPPLQQGLTDFLATYGHRSHLEFDLGVVRWADDPTAVLALLVGYLQYGGDLPTPMEHLRRAAAAADAMVAELTQRAARRSPLRGLLVALSLRRARALSGLRELPRFLLVLRLAQAQQLLAPVAATLHATGQLARLDDLSMLSLPEMEAALAGEEMRSRITERRAASATDQERRQVPLVLLSDGTVPSVARPVTATADVLQGTAASPGQATGIARVLFDPQGAVLQPGEILVAPATDPAWTPLFPTAAGLVMEVGGAMAHGAIVAREYGIPAVVGVPGATTQIRTGQRLTIDGTTGTVLHAPDTLA